MAEDETEQKKPAASREEIQAALEKLKYLRFPRKAPWFPDKRMRRGVSLARERAQRRSRHAFIANSVKQANEIAAKKRAARQKLCFLDRRIAMTADPIATDNLYKERDKLCTSVEGPMTSGILKKI